MRAKRGRRLRKPNGKALADLCVRRSSIHGKGVYTTRIIRKGTRIIEYTGARLPWKIARKLPPHDTSDIYHTFYYSLENGDVIDAGNGGNESRWINHSCEPNCATDEERSRIFIYALRTIYPGEELLYDYLIQPAERRTKRVERAFACFCGSPLCRRTMLEPTKTA
jgi:SET domain-containing protein